MMMTDARGRISNSSIEFESPAINDSCSGRTHGGVLVVPKT